MSTTHDQGITEAVSSDDAVTSIASMQLNRRKLRFAGGVAGLTVIAAACGKDDNKDSTSTGSTDDDGTSDTTGKDDGAGDLAVAKFAAGLEVLAVGTYKAALEAATGGKLGTVPPAVATFAQTAMKNHTAHRDAWNKVITGAGGTEVTEADKTLSPVVAQKFGVVKDVVGAARLALELEEIAAATYLSAIPSLKDPAAIKLAASIQAIDAKHAAILHYALGEYPVPDVFAKTDKAAKPS
ncbi:MAG TPA: ferritin-like domain-containing protein [Acidimicrobiales bacterium]|nr:ferritin-like domain-containing protein [Acidimicrobiales bacterium]